MENRERMPSFDKIHITEDCTPLIRPKKKHQRRISLNNALRILAIMVCQVFCMGVPWSLGVLYSDLLEVFDASTSATASIASTCTAVTLISGILGSLLIGRFGVRVTLVGGGLCISGGLFISFFANGVYYLIVSIGLVTGFGCGLVLVGSFAAVADGFQENKNIVFGIAAAAGGAGITLLQQLFHIFFLEYGWRSCFFIIGAMSLNTVAAGMLLGSPRASVHNEKSPNLIFDFVIYKMSAFIIALFYISMVTTTMDISALILTDFAKESGFSDENSVTALSFRSFFSIIGRFSTGAFVHVIPKGQVLNLVCLCFAGCGLSLLLIPYFEQINGLYEMSSVHGFFLGLCVSIVPVYTFHIVGLRMYSQALGSVNTMRGVVSLSLGPMVGIIHDATGSYFACFVIGGAFIMGATSMYRIFSGLKWLTNR